MRILVYGLSPQKGGVESFIINYCTGIARIYNDVQFEFVVFDEVPSYAAFLQEQGFVFHVAPNRVQHPIRNKSKLTEIIETGEYDAVWYNACTLSDVTLLKAAEGKIPLRVIHSHNSVNMGTALNGMLHEYHKRQLPELATDLFSCSQEASSFMFSNALNEKAVRTVSNGIDVSRFAYDEEARHRLRHENGWNNKLLVITVGRMHKQKNPLFLIDVFKRLHAINPAAHLVYIGDGPMRNQVMECVKDYRLNEDVTILNAIDKVQDYLSASDVFLLPSLYEGLPFAIVEAQASGLPVVMSEGISKEAIFSDSVIRLPLENIEQWVTTISDLAATTIDRSKGAESVRNAGFDIEENARELGAWFLKRNHDLAK